MRHSLILVVLSSLAVAVQREGNSTPGQAKQLDPRGLMRRLHFDLTGLPPTYETVAQFEKNPSPEALEKIVDQLLASRAYAEREARFSLDAARYGESDGGLRNSERPHASRYRDWLVRISRDDMPWKERVELQIAGDLLAPDDPDAHAATGFLVAGAWEKLETKSETALHAARLDELDEMTDAVGRSFLGLSLGCARCHDHKSEPVTRRDYQRFAAVFAGVSRSEHTVKNQQIYGVISTHLTKLDSEAGSLSQLGPEETFGTKESPDAERRKKFAQWLARRPETARVRVNRLYERHLGKPLVAEGSFRTNRELDTAMMEFTKSGERTKPLQKKLLLSEGYKTPLKRRLEGEMVRDSILAVSGLLEESTTTGSDLKKFAESGAIRFEIADESTFRGRSLYRFLPRSASGGLVAAFDPADMVQATPFRRTTTTLDQAVALETSRLVRKAAQTLAKREFPDRLQSLFRATLQRDPTQREVESLQDVVREGKWDTLAQALLTCDEFLCAE